MRVPRASRVARWRRHRVAPPERLLFAATKASAHVERSRGFLHVGSSTPAGSLADSHLAAPPRCRRSMASRPVRRAPRISSGDVPTSVELTAARSIARRRHVRQPTAQASARSRIVAASCAQKRVRRPASTCAVLAYSLTRSRARCTVRHGVDSAGGPSTRRRAHGRGSPGQLADAPRTVASHLSEPAMRTAQWMARRPWCAGADAGADAVAVAPIAATAAATACASVSGMLDSTREWNASGTAGAARWQGGGGAGDVRSAERSGRRTGRRRGLMRSAIPCSSSLPNPPDTTAPPADRTMSRPYKSYTLGKSEFVVSGARVEVGPAAL